MKQQEHHQHSANKQKQNLWATMVLRKWLNIRSKKPEYVADSDDTEDDPETDSDNEEWRTGSRYRDSKNDETPSESCEFLPGLRRQKSLTVRSQYINKKELRVCVGTWNVGGKLPPNDLDIDDWLDVNHPADIYVLGLQEIVPLNTSNIFGGVDTRHVPKWENIIKETLNRVQPKPSKIKSFSDPPSPSKFKPSDDAPDIEEEEMLLESDGDIGEEIHPLDEGHDQVFDRVIDKPITHESLNMSLKDSNAADIANSRVIVDNDLENQLSYQRRLDRLNCLRGEDLSANIETPSPQPISKLSRMVSGTERIGLSWPEPPLHLLSHTVLERATSLKPVKTLNATKSFRATDSFRSKTDAMDLLAEIDLEALMKRKTRSSYVKIVSKQMVGIYITIWVRRSVRKHIQNLKVSTVGVGVMGYIGNKGSAQPKPQSSQSNPELIISRMLANRVWTTRLQNSIRSIAPEFDSNLVWNILHASTNPDQALKFYRWLERSNLFTHDAHTTLKMLQILTRFSKLNHARCILLDLPNKNLPYDEDMFVALIEGYGRAGIVQEAVKIFHKLEQKSVKSYDALFKVILRRGRYMMTKRLYNAMLREGIEPTRHTYNILLWGMFLSLRLNTAIRFYQDMKSKGIEPDVVTYNTLIHGYFRFKKVDEAESLFVEMKEKNIVPNVISYTTMLKGFVDVGKVDRALEVFQEMKSCGIKANAVTFTTLLPGLCDADKLVEAGNLLGEMVERYIAPKDNSVFMKLMDCQCKAGNLDAAVDVLKAMVRLSIPTEAGHYGVLIESFCKAKVYDRAEKLLDKLIEKDIVLRPENSFEIEASAYNSMIEYLCDNGKTVKAETFFRQLMKKGVLDPVAFNNLFRGHSKEGNPESALEIATIMSRRGVPSDADSYRLLIDSYLRKGEPADAKTALDHMLEGGHQPDSSLYRSVMESLFEDGRVQTAGRVMKTMVEKGVKENMDLVPKILEALLLRGHVEEALGRIDLLMHNGYEPDFDHLISTLCEKEKRIAALRLLDFVLERDIVIDFSIYDKVLDTLLAAGRTLNAYSVLCKILEKRGATDWSSRDELIKSLNQEGNTKQADVLSRIIKEKVASPPKREGKKKESKVA